MLLPQKVLHAIEKKIIASIADGPKSLYREVGPSTGLSPDQIRRGIEWLKLKGLIIVNGNDYACVQLGANGNESALKGLPERRLLNLLRTGPLAIHDLQKELGPVFSSAMGIAKKNSWIDVLSTPTGQRVSLNNNNLPSGKIPGEDTLTKVVNYYNEHNARHPLKTLDKYDLKALSGRPDFITTTTMKMDEVELTPAGRKFVTRDHTMQTVAASADPITSRAIDVEADVPVAYAARTHPLQDTIDEIREIFVTLGFTEIVGPMTQSSFWNFDALFTPQDHPAREMQDTFYLGGVASSIHDIPATRSQIRGVSTSHTKNWRYKWSDAEARRMVLRTHTTCVTIKSLAENKPDEARIFSLGRVFRNEKTSYKHLVEFNQIEGVVTGSNATLRDLMGIQKEFYRRIGITKIKFWPTFFPYTEPSLQTMVYNDRMAKWVELFGMGIFRSEVTKPLGITKPVLAWGGGIERIAMLKYGIDDVREFYSGSLGWLRGAAI